jgi:predicted small secreted protein
MRRNEPIDEPFRKPGLVVAGRRFAIAAVCAMGAVASLTLSGCNTVEGAGKDVEKAGEAVQDAAN